MNSTASQLTDRDRANLSRLIDYTSIQSVPEIWAIVEQKFGQIVALHEPHHCRV
jgi:long-chain acyl-CoA synthetase